MAAALGGRSFYERTFLGRDRFVQRDERLPIVDLPAALDGFTIAHLSDIHAGPFLRAGGLTHVVDAINARSVDACALTGDFLTHHWSEAVLVTEDLARHMHRRYGVDFIGLRFSNIFYDTKGHVTGYEKVPTFWDDPAGRRFNLWGYVDARDVAQACVKSLTADVTGAEVVTIAAPDTIMKQTNEELIAAAFPGCALRPGTGPHDSLISIDKARQLIGYAPEWTWRRVLGMD